jgi:membrane associated rhomboid family serine protease
VFIPLTDKEVPRHGTPYVNYAIIGINVLVFLYSLTLSGLDETVFVLRFGLLPVELTSDVSAGVVSAPGGGTVDLSSPVPNWATLITSMFMHGGLMHIGSNMLYLWVFGDNVEDRLGHVGYAAFYLAMGIAASGLHIAFNWSSEIPTIGASGAIAGVLGAYLMYYAFHRVQTLILFGFFIMVRAVPAGLLLGYWGVYQLLSQFVFGGSSGVAYWAHIGGFAAGMGFVAASRLMRGQRAWQPDHRRGFHRYY